jgi:hypothetical protein
VYVHSLTVLLWASTFQRPSSADQDASEEQCLTTGLEHHSASSSGVSDDARGVVRDGVGAVSVADLSINKQREAQRRMQQAVIAVYQALKAPITTPARGRPATRVIDKLSPQQVTTLLWCFAQVRCMFHGIVLYCHGFKAARHSAIDMSVALAYLCTHATTTLVSPMCPARHVR